MKRIAFLTLIFLAVIIVAQGQPSKEDKSQLNGTRKEMKSERVPLKKLKGTEVSEISRNNFETDFGNIPDVKWKRNGAFDEAEFLRNGKLMTAYYDIDGNLVGTTRLTEFKNIPSAGQKEIQNRYKGYIIGPTVFFEDNEVNDTDMILYGIQFDDADTYLVELTKGTDKIVVQVDKDGLVSFFKQL